MSHTEPTPTDDETTSERTPRDATKTPKRFVSIWVDRESDRWVAYLLSALLVASLLFVVYTSWRQNQAAEERALIFEGVQQQNHDLLCFADNTQSFELSITRYLLIQQQARPDDPQTKQALDDLRRVEDQLQTAKQLCFGRDPSTVPTIPSPSSTR